jgi:hypothetical protein
MSIGLLRNGEGLSALDLAKKKNNMKVLEMYLKKITENKEICYSS